MRLRKCKNSDQSRDAPMSCPNNDNFIKHSGLYQMCWRFVNNYKLTCYYTHMASCPVKKLQAKFSHISYIIFNLKCQKRSSVEQRWHSDTHSWVDKDLATLGSWPVRGRVLTTHSVLLQSEQAQQSQTWLQAHWELIKCLQYFKVWHDNKIIIWGRKNI